MSKDSIETKTNENQSDNYHKQAEEYKEGLEIILKSTERERDGYHNFNLFLQEILKSDDIVTATEIPPNDENLLAHYNAMKFEF